jgi:hypothetical protein
VVRYDCAIGQRLLPPPNTAFLRNRHSVDGFSGEERPLAVVEVPADRCARNRSVFEGIAQRARGS